MVNPSLGMKVIVAVVVVVVVVVVVESHSFYINIMVEPPLPLTCCLASVKQHFFSKTSLPSRRHDESPNRGRCCCNVFGHYQVLSVYTGNGDCLPPIYSAKPLLFGPPFFVGGRGGPARVPSEPSRLSSKTPRFFDVNFCAQGSGL